MATLRVTEAEVKAIIDTDLTNEQVTPFLTAANVLVTDVTAGYEYGDELLHEIEKWLAAHFLAARDPIASKEKLGEANITYQVKLGEGLKSTAYGQRVLLLDIKGKFVDLSTVKGEASIKVIA